MDLGPGSLYIYKVHVKERRQQPVNIISLYNIFKKKAKPFVAEPTDPPPAVPECRAEECSPRTEEITDQVYPNYIGHALGIPGISDKEKRVFINCWKPTSPSQMPTSQHGRFTKRLLLSHLDEEKYSMWIVASCFSTSRNYRSLL